MAANLQVVIYRLHSSVYKGGQSKISPLVRESNTVLETGFHAQDSGFQACTCFQSFLVELGFWIPVLNRILDSLSCIPYSKAQDSRFHKQKFHADPGSQIPLHRAKKNKPDFLCSTSFLYFTKYCLQIWWCVIQPFILFIHHIWGKQYYEALVFYHTDLRQNAVFHNFARQITLNQYSGRSKHALPLHKKLRIDHIIKRFHKENSIISGLLSQNSLLLCDMEGKWAFSKNA